MNSEFKRIKIGWVWEALLLLNIWEIFQKSFGNLIWLCQITFLDIHYILDFIKYKWNILFKTCHKISLYSLCLYFSYIFSENMCYVKNHNKFNLNLSLEYRKGLYSRSLALLNIVTPCINISSEVLKAQFKL